VLELNRRHHPSCPDAWVLGLSTAELSRKIAPYQRGS